jgi:GntR family transcriptional regulator/MocR family aminotransferase
MDGVCSDDGPGDRAIFSNWSRPLPKRANDPMVLNLNRSASAGAPMHGQIYRSLREGILAGGLAAGSRLPSTRTLAADLGVSRNTAEEAYAQLEAEGFVTRKVGDGTYVASAVRRTGVRRANASVSRALSARGRAIAREAACDEPEVLKPFNAGAAEVREFPFDTWHRVLSRRSRKSGRAILGYIDPAGYQPLRDAVASYLNVSRDVRCDAGQVLIVTSSQQALDLCARLLLDPYDRVWIENPAYPGARAAFTGAGATLVPVGVDEQGLDVDGGVRAAPEARMAYVTPSHQYPLGVTMSLERRLALLRWAARSRAWIVEDDYDSEFRYDGRPLAAIQGLADDARVIYIGTFSKVMFPSIRIAYLVLPDALVDAFARARAQQDGHNTALMQAALADFIVNGYFVAHVRRMRALYRARRDLVVSSIVRDLGGALTLGPADSGFNVAARLTVERSEEDIVRRAGDRGIDLRPLSRFAIEPIPDRGFLLGYAALTPPIIRKAVSELARVMA